eukprot:573079-Prymnesium_polylepis.1
MGACPRLGRHDAHVLAADVAVAGDRCTWALLEPSASAVARCVADLAGRGYDCGRVSRARTGQGAESRRPAWPHGRVRGTPHLRHQKVRTPYGTF